ncbi:unnamed protein product [Blepharisma stoltei]|uniref:RCC1-like domain-containing protein n=1 Tax=Blepharisma stoltei TaxID=1481888 RepID=A0AAU9ITV4_9CILI|nr:unnamed protein product [Blepharisma stoltei]
MEEYTEVFAWGGDHFGQLGLGTKQASKTYPVPRFCSFNVLIKDISCSEQHSCFITQSGHVFTMGSNSEGRLGIGDQSVKQCPSPCLVEYLSLYRASSVSCGWGHTVVITEEGYAFSWGVGEFGALGNGTSDTQWSPVKVKIPDFIRCKKVSCGSRHTAILGDDGYESGILFLFGAGEAGQLGTGRREREMLPIRIQSNEEILQVSCGVFHTGFITKSGSVYMMGGNSFGQLGLGNKKSVSIPKQVQNLDGIFISKIACGNHTAVLSDKGQVYVWGTGIFGEFLVPQRFSFANPIRDIGVGGCFGMAIDNNFSVYAWGSNSNGELGTGDYETRVKPVPIIGLQGKQVKFISCGSNSCLALGSDITKGRSSQPKSRENTPLKTKTPQKNSEIKEAKSVQKPSYLKRRLSAEQSNKKHLKRNGSFGSGDKLEKLKNEIKSPWRYDGKSAPISVNKSFSYIPHNNHEVETEIFSKNNQIDELNLRLDQVMREYRANRAELQAVSEAYAELKASSQHMQIEIDEKMRLKDDQSYQQSRLLEISAINQELARDMSILKKNLEEANHTNYLSSTENKSLKEENMRLKRSLDEFIHQSKLENQKLDNLFVKEKESVILENRDLKAQLEEEKIRRKQIERDFEAANSHRRRLDDLLNISQNKLEEVQNLSQNSFDALQEEIRQGKLKNDQKDSLIAQLQYKLEEIQKLSQSSFNSLQEEIHKGKIQIDQKDSLIAQLQYNSDNFSQENERLRLEIEEYKNLLDNKSVENENIQNELKEARYQQSILQENLKEKESINLAISADIESIGKDLSDKIAESKYLKSSFDDMKYEIEKLHQQLEEKNALLDQVTKIGEDWKNHYNQSEFDKNKLSEELADLQMKNQQLFDNLQKELAQRAKEYKERAITLLNTPMRSIPLSPYGKPSPASKSPRNRSPSIHDIESLPHFKEDYSPTSPSKSPSRKELQKEHQDRLASTASRLMESTEVESPLRHLRVSSPSRRSPERPSPFKSKENTSATFRSLQSTPSKTDVKAKIAALMESRARIERQMQDLNSENI